MIRPGVRRERRRDSALAPQTSDEVRQLRDQVGRLEQALVDVLAASDAVVSDLGRRRGRRVDAGPSGGFAGEWADRDLKAVEARVFFSDANIDVRARSWLLGPKRQSLLSRVRFGRTQQLRPPVLAQLQPALVATR